MCIAEPLEQYYQEQSMQERVAQLMALFRMLIPDLCKLYCILRLKYHITYIQVIFCISLLNDFCFDSMLDNYFEEEEVSVNDWAFSWLQSLLARELKLDNLMRLWDSYLSFGWQRHPFVCLAILRYWKDTLEELEHSEIVSFLNKLPAMDVDEVSN